MTAVKEDKVTKVLEQQEELRNLIAEGLNDMISGNVKDFDCVFDRLEKKYLQELNDGNEQIPYDRDMV